MAHSIQAVGDRAEIINDLDVLALIGMLINSAGELPECYPLLGPFIRGWREQCIYYGPGLIDLNLEGLAAIEPARSQFVELLAAVEKQLAAHGETIPASRLVSSEAIGVTLGDYPTAMIKITAERIRTLMTP